MNFFLVAAFVLSLHPNRVPDSYTPRELFEKCRARAARIDSTLNKMNIRFIQSVEMRSRTGTADSLAFEITSDHGKLTRRLLFSSVPNGGRFNGGYDAFDRMFHLSDYFSGRGKVLSSCDFGKSSCGKCLGIRFTLSSPSDPTDPLSTVSASVDASDFTPVHIEEHLKGLPLGVEFEDNVDVAYNNDLRVYFPNKIVMQVYGTLFFLKGEVAVITIRNGDLQRI